MLLRPSPFLALFRMIAPLLCGSLVAQAQILRPILQAPTIPNYVVQELTGLDGIYTTVALNDAGEVAGKYITTGDGGGGGTSSRAAPTTNADEPFAFVWKNGVVRKRFFPGKAFTVNGMNNKGVVVGTVTAPGLPPKVFIWRSQSDELTTVPTPTGPVLPDDINDHLMVVGLEWDGVRGFALNASSGAYHPFLMDRSTVQNVGTPGTTAINRNGMAVGSEVGFRPDLGFFIQEPYRWKVPFRRAKLTTLGHGGHASDVSADGSIAGHVFDQFNGNLACFWSRRGQLTTVGYPEGYFVAKGTAINSRDQLTVEAPNDFFGFTRAFVWIIDEFVDLTTFTQAQIGLNASKPIDINEDGFILVELSDNTNQTLRGAAILKPRFRFGPILQGPRSGNPTF